MPRVTLRMTDLSPKIKDSLGVESDNQLYPLFWFAALQGVARRRDQAEDTVRNYRATFTSNLQKVTIDNIPQTDLPGIARLVQIHDITSGDYTVGGLHFMLGITNARYTTAIRFEDGAGQVIPAAQWTDVQKDLFTKPDGSAKKWSDFIDGVNYTVITFEASGVTRNWISVNAIRQNGITVEQYKAFKEAIGVRIETDASYQALAAIAFPPGP